MNFWDARYAENDYAYGKAPNDFLAANAHLMSGRRVLCLAEGEGRNAVFLAQRGFDVHAVDLSAVGLTKARALAAERGTAITTEVADLGAIVLDAGRWDGIVSIFAHMPLQARCHLHGQVVRALKPGGLMLLEAYTSRHREIDGIGGPGIDQQEFFMSIPALREELPTLDFVVANELDREIEEGRYHRGRSAVVQLIARKPSQG